MYYQNYQRRIIKLHSFHVSIEKYMTTYKRDIFLYIKEVIYSLSIPASNY